MFSGTPRTGELSGRTQQEMDGIYGVEGSRLPSSGCEIDTTESLLGRFNSQQFPVPLEMLWSPAPSSAFDEGGERPSGCKCRGHLLSRYSFLVHRPGDCPQSVLAMCSGWKGHPTSGYSEAQSLGGPEYSICHGPDQRSGPDTRPPRTSQMPSPCWEDGIGQEPQRLQALCFPLR